MERESIYSEEESGSFDDYRQNYLAILDVEKQLEIDLGTTDFTTKTLFDWRKELPKSIFLSLVDLIRNKKIALELLIESAKKLSPEASSGTYVAKLKQEYSKIDNYFDDYLSDEVRFIPPEYYIS